METTNNNNVKGDTPRIEDELLSVEFFKENVFVNPSKDETIPGTLYLLKHDSTKQFFIGWGPLNTQTNLTESKTEMNRMYSVRIPIKDIHSIRRHIPAFGFPSIVVLTKAGVAMPPYYFGEGGIREFFRALRNHLTVIKGSEPNVFHLTETSQQFPVPQYESPPIPSEPFTSALVEELSWSLLEKFAKVTQLASRAFQEQPSSEPPLKGPFRPHWRQLLHSTSVGSFELMESSDFELPQVERTSPLTRREWENMFDDEGKIRDEEYFRQRVHYGGVESEIRSEVWKFLVQFFPLDSTKEQREVLLNERKEKYFEWKRLWQTIAADKECKFSKLHSRAHSIGLTFERKNSHNTEKDVLRTDRNMDFYQQPENLKALQDLLMTYCFFNFDLGYAQGMNELLSPIWYLMQDEVEAFWTFKHLMDNMEGNFHKDQSGMQKQLLELAGLIKTMDLELYEYLGISLSVHSNEKEKQDCLNLFFCFRWLIIIFKRELSFDDSMRMWEVLWANHLTPKFHLFVALNILLKHRETIIQEQLQFDDIVSVQMINSFSQAVTQRLGWQMENQFVAGGIRTIVQIFSPCCETSLVTIK